MLDRKGVQRECSTGNVISWGALGQKRCGIIVARQNLELLNVPGSQWPVLDLHSNTVVLRDLEGCTYETGTVDEFYARHYSIAGHLPEGQTLPDGLYGGVGEGVACTKLVLLFEERLEALVKEAREHATRIGGPFRSPSYRRLLFNVTERLARKL